MGLRHRLESQGRGGVSAIAEDRVARGQVREVLEHYCALLDAGPGAELLALFDDDCEFTMMGRTYAGKSQLGAVWADMAVRERPHTLHALVSPRITVDGDRANAVSGWIMVDRNQPDGSTRVALAGRYHDSLRRGADGCWRFVHRRVESLARPPAAQLA